MKSQIFKIFKIFRYALFIILNFIIVLFIFISLIIIRECTGSNELTFDESTATFSSDRPIKRFYITDKDGNHYFVSKRKNSRSIKLYKLYDGFDHKDYNLFFLKKNNKYTITNSSFYDATQFDYYFYTDSLNNIHFVYEPEQIKVFYKDSILPGMNPQKR